LCRPFKFAVGISVEPAEVTGGAISTAEERSTDSLTLMVGHNHALLKIDGFPGKTDGFALAKR
jgi:hypothetical protein